MEAYDLTGSFRDAAELAGCSHHTVQHYVRAREEQRLTADVVRRAMLIDPFLAVGRLGGGRASAGRQVWM